MEEVIDELREDGISIGAISLRTFRPFPLSAVSDSIEHAKRVVVFEKCLAVGLGGIVASNVRMALRGHKLPVYSVIGGLGGRPITRSSLHRLFDKAVRDELEETHFLDLNHEVVERELTREMKDRNSGAIAENILRDIGIVSTAKTA